MSKNMLIARYGRCDPRSRVHAPYSACRVDFD
jgi:hypothetical protein